jgi:hypothetical protein
MVPVKYSNLGFDIANFGARSKVLRFSQKPIFVFNTDSPMDGEFISHICASYLSICEKRKSTVSLKM